MANTMKNFDEIIQAVRDGMLPYESWEKLNGESSAAFSAFCAFRDYGPNRNIKRAVASVESDTKAQAKKYMMWRNWSTKFQWFKRAEDYDVYLDKLKQTERRKTLEEREAAHREITGKMLLLAGKKLDMTSPGELTANNVSDWVKTAVDIDRAAVVAFGNLDCGTGTVTKGETKNDNQLSLNFTDDFKDL